MTPEEILTMASLVLGITSILGLAYTAGVKVTRLETKLDVLWAAWLDWGQGLAMKKGRIVKGSGLHPSPAFESKYVSALTAMRLLTSHLTTSDQAAKRAQVLMQKCRPYLVAIALEEDCSIDEALAVCTVACGDIDEPKIAL